MPEHPYQATAGAAMLVRPVAGMVGAAVEGLDLRRAPDPTTVEELRHLLARYGVLFFPDQQMGPAGHRALAQAFGEARTPPAYVTTLAEEGFPEIGVLTSDGVGRLADVWHSDVTWSPEPPRYSILHMQTSPEFGGDTMWASLSDAYDQLSHPMQTMLSSLTALHSIGAPNETVHPVVHQHPITGRRALYVNPMFTRRICELAPKESDAVLAILYEATARPESTCRWRWHDGDVAIWDNHFVVHYAIPDYPEDVYRKIHRIEVAGPAPIPVTS